ncbi:MAG TPA: glycosyltransferase family 9 protein [Candidatus Kapabacteria bacterium]|nr:glycosyltransferase family 9 protein [Candidatus Kapabacteria bacterium]HYM36684.1 glycosyltransferase family 9 protein [Steroidobacteraceae bacterium]
MAKQTEKILIIALPGIGDALLSTPMIRLLRDAKPDAEIHAFVMFSATRDLYRANPNIDHVHHFDFLHSPKIEGILFLMHLRSIGFDISINIYPQNRREYNILSLIIGASQRLGVRYRRRDWQNFNWLSTDTIFEDDSYHCVEENVRLLSLIGITPKLDEHSLPPLEIYLSDEDRSYAVRWLAERNIEHSDHLVGIHAGTALFKNHIKRRWAPDKFAQLAKRLKDELGATTLLFGGPDDKEANEVIIKNAGDSVTEVKTDTIMHSIALMKKMKLFVSNDSALMHIAGGLKLPTIAIFGPTNETYVHPWKTKYEIVHTGIECRPCFVYSPKSLVCYRVNPDEHFMCIRDIEVEQVFDAVTRLLQ